MPQEKKLKKETPKISIKRIAIALSLTILVFTSLGFGYLYFEELENNSMIDTVSNQKDSGLTEEDSETTLDTECDTKNIGNYNWVSYISKEGNILYYKEVNKDDDTVCKYEIYSIPDKKLVHSPHLHITQKRVTFFLTDYNDYETAQYYIVDLTDDSLIETGITIDHDGPNYTIKYSGSEHYDKYIISYPIGAGGSAEEFETFWDTGTIYVLDTDGRSYEIPCDTLPYYKSLIFTQSSSPDLLAITLSGNKSNIEAFYDLSELLTE